MICRLECLRVAVLPIYIIHKSLKGCSDQLLPKFDGNGALYNKFKQILILKKEKKLRRKKTINYRYEYIPFMDIPCPEL